MIKADLHIHTAYSPDSNTPLERIITRCLEIGINCIAITDHNTIAGALEMKRLAPFGRQVEPSLRLKVIVGEEIQTLTGEIIGYFLSEEVPRGLPAEEAAYRIKEQGGAVCIPHPFDSFRSSALRRQSLEALVPYIDIIEVFNSRLLLPRQNAMAHRFAQAHGLLSSAGSDAHTSFEIGNTYVEMPEFNDKGQFLLALAKGDVVGRRANPWVHLWSNWARLEKYLRGR
ncbi:MAG: PHP domain-containing protein [Dehalococcoidia bacterium]|nr:PHP domain-containing protein [Dehalococcoidia bacterium]